MSDLILASSSPYRAQLLRRFNIPFKAINPNIDEDPCSDELPVQLVQRLSLWKAEAIARSHPGCTVIGSDQVCAHKDQIIGKPMTAANACKQLQSFSDNCIEFFTGLCVITHQGQALQHVDQTKVTFRTLEKAEILRYVEQEKPLDCAGSFKVESMGLSLFKSVESKDPSALVGLPLIKLAAFLRTAGYVLP